MPKSRPSSATSKDRIETDGEPVLLNPQAYSTMALVIHELVTNSAKYGSLSENGRVEVRWSLDNGGALVIDWLEVGGPTVEPNRPARASARRSSSTACPTTWAARPRSITLPTASRARFVIPGKHVVRGPRSIKGIAESPTAVADASRRSTIARLAGRERGPAGRGQPDHRPRRRGHAASARRAAK